MGGADEQGVEGGRRDRLVLKLAGLFAAGCRVQVLRRLDLRHQALAAIGKVGDALGGLVEAAETGFVEGDRRAWRAQAGGLGLQGGESGWA